MSDFSLTLFSVCLEAAIGIMFFTALTRLKNNDLDSKAASVAASVFAVIGMLASLLHLGRPLRALNSLLNLGTSWLSREILLTGLFAGCCIVCAAVNLWKPAMRSALQAFEWAASLCGIVLLYAMGSVYYYTGAASWRSANTYIEYYTSTIAIGAIMFFAFTYRQQDKRSNRLLGTVALAAVAVQLIGSELHAAALAAGSSAGAESAGLLGASVVPVALKWVLLLGGIWLFYSKAASRVAGETPNAKTANREIAYMASAIVFVGLFIGKYLFYVTMVTTGIG